MSEDIHKVEHQIEEVPKQREPLVSIVELWKGSLQKVVERYDHIRPQQRFFRIKLFGFFVLTNISCYWLGIGTAFPFLLTSEKAHEYVLLQFPVGLMGACFDTLSFFVTIWIARNAIKSTNTWVFLFHLSLDVLLAFLATMWVVLVFIVSGWGLSFILGTPEGLDDRSAVYQGRLLDALMRPFENIRNIYFGIIMGMSAALPSIIHIALFVYAFVQRLRAYGKRSTPNVEPPIQKTTAQD